MSTRPTPRARPESSRDKVRAHRERLSKRGLRPIQIWVPDVPRILERLGHRRLKSIGPCAELAQVFRS